MQNYFGFNERVKQWSEVLHLLQQGTNMSCTTLQKKDVFLSFFFILVVVVRFWSSSGSRHVSHFIKIVSSETASMSTFPRSLQLGPRRKPECLPEIISAWVTIQMRSLSKALCGSGVLIPTTPAYYEVFHLHYWIQLSSGIPRSVQSITLPDHSHVSNAIMSTIQRRSLQWRQIFLHVDHNN